MLIELIITVSALIFGFLLSFVRTIKDEIKEGKKYFILTQKILLAVLLLFLLKDFNINIIPGILLGIILALIIKIPQLYLGTILALNFNQSLISLTFLFNLINSTLEKNNKILILKIILLLLPFTLVSFINANFLLGIGIGSLLTILYKGP